MALHRQTSIAAEVAALRSLRRQSMSVHTDSDPHTPFLPDPDLPPSSSPSLSPSSSAFPSPSLPTTTSPPPPTNPLDLPIVPGPNTGTDQTSTDPHSLFWLPAAIHPAVAPHAFRQYLARQSHDLSQPSSPTFPSPTSPAPEGHPSPTSLSEVLLERRASIGHVHAAAAGLGRKRSMLSRQYRPSSTDDDESHGKGQGEAGVPDRPPRRPVQNLARARSDRHTPTLTLDDLQRLEALADGALLAHDDGNDDPARLAHAIQRSFSLDHEGPDADFAMGRMGIRSDGPDIPVRSPESSLKRSTRTGRRTAKGGSSRPTSAATTASLSTISSARSSTDMTSTTAESEAEHDPASSAVHALSPPSSTAAASVPPLRTWSAAPAEPVLGLTPSSSFTGLDELRPLSLISENEIVDSYNRSREPSASSTIGSPPPTRPAPPSLPPPAVSFESEQSGLGSSAAAAALKTPTQESSIVFDTEPQTPKAPSSVASAPPSWASLMRPIQLADEEDDFIQPSSPHVQERQTPVVSQPPAGRGSGSIPPGSTIPVQTSEPSQTVQHPARESSPVAAVQSHTQHVAHPLPQSQPQPQQKTPALSSAKSMPQLISPSRTQSASSIISTSSTDSTREKKSGWSWKLGRSTKKEKLEKTGKTVTVDASAPSAAEKSSPKPRTKEKDKSLLSSIFSSKQKKAAPAIAAAAQNAQSNPAQERNRPNASFGNFGYRYPINVERALYRLSHMKLANPRRPLLEQVLISNLMFWYLSIINRAQVMASQAHQAQQAQIIAQQAQVSVQQDSATQAYDQSESDSNSGIDNIPLHQLQQMHQTQAAEQWQRSQRSDTPPHHAYQMQQTEHLNQGRPPDPVQSYSAHSEDAYSDRGANPRHGEASQATPNYAAPSDRSHPQSQPYHQYPGHQSDFQKIQNTQPQNFQSSGAETSQAPIQSSQEQNVASVPKQMPTYQSQSLPNKSSQRMQVAPPAPYIDYQNTNSKGRVAALEPQIIPPMQYRSVSAPNYPVIRAASAPPIPQERAGVNMLDGSFNVIDDRGILQEGSAYPAFTSSNRASQSRPPEPQIQPPSHTEQPMRSKQSMHSVEPAVKGRQPTYIEREQAWLASGRQKGSEDAYQAASYSQYYPAAGPSTDMYQLPPGAGVAQHMPYQHR